MSSTGYSNSHYAEAYGSSNQHLTTQQGKMSSHKKFFLAVIVLIVLAVLGGGGYYGYNYWRETRWVDINECRITECGKVGPKYVATRIIGGRDAREDEFPYQVAFTITDDTTVFCGGNLINDRWILTAAHCFFLSDGRQIIGTFIKVSVAVMKTNEIAANRIGIENYWVHPQYKPGQKYYDIALVKTTKSVKSASKHYTNPICLPYDGIDSQKVQLVTVSGFGATKENANTSHHTLRTTNLKIQKASECQNKYDSFDSESMICAGEMNGGQDTCQGDSGGPMVIKNENGSYVLKGLTSFGAGCGRRNTPGVYTKVAHYMMWTCRKMLNNGFNG